MCCLGMEWLANRLGLPPPFGPKPFYSIPHTSIGSRALPRRRAPGPVRGAECATIRSLRPQNDGWDPYGQRLPGCPRRRPHAPARPCTPNTARKMITRVIQSRQLHRQTRINSDNHAFPRTQSSFGAKRFLGGVGVVLPRHEKRAQTSKKNAKPLCFFFKMFFIAFALCSHAQGPPRLPEADGEVRRAGREDRGASRKREPEAARRTRRKRRQGNRQGRGEWPRQRGRAKRAGTSRWASNHLIAQQSPVQARSSPSGPATATSGRKGTPREKSPLPTPEYAERETVKESQSV